MEKTVQKMAEQVDDFQRKILRVPYKNGMPERSRIEHMREEVDEILAAYDAGDIKGVVDGIVDDVYVALGTLLQMGIPPDWPFDEVHKANMKKRGAKTARHDYDAIKPAGWEPPNFDVMFQHLEILKQVSPIFVELTELRIRKGQNYNGGTVKRSDHFPLGDLSFFQVVWMKMCRVRSLVETKDQNPDARRLIQREINDIMVYSCFWAEFIKGLEL